MEWWQTLLFTVIPAIISAGATLIVSRHSQIKKNTEAINNLIRQIGTKDGDSSIVNKIGVDVNTLSIADRIGVNNNEPSIADRIGVSKNEPSLSSQIGIFQKSDYSLSTQHKELAKLMQHSIDVSEKRYNDEATAIKNFTLKELDTYRSIEEFKLLLESWGVLSKENREMATRIIELESDLDEAHRIIDEKEKIIVNLSAQTDDSPKQGFSQNLTMQ